MDTQFVERLMQVIRQYASHPGANVGMIAREMAMCESILYERVHNNLGVTPNDLLRQVRMNHAMELLKTGEYKIADVAYQCGFSDWRYFSTVFKRFYGYSPSAVKNKA